MLGLGLEANPMVVAHHILEVAIPNPNPNPILTY